MNAARKCLLAIALLLAAAAAWQVGTAGWIHAKAIVAQRLIAHSWRQARAGHPAPRPWPWADLRPVARLVVPSRGVDLFVLDSATPRALAFGPAHVGGTARPASGGNTVLVAHRDTHFSFLRDIAPGDEVSLQGVAGAPARYRVREIAVVDQGDARVLDPAHASQLTLVTCYPFDAIRPGTRLRFVVIARRIGAA